MAVSAAKIATVKFFELYGILRVAGKTPREALDILALEGDDLTTTVAGAIGSISARQAAAGVLSTIGASTIQMLATAIPVVGSVGGQVASALSTVGGMITEQLRVGCSSGCASGDERGAVGLWPPPGFAMLGATPLVFFLHDGLVVSPPSRADWASFGARAGARARIQDGAPDPQNRSAQLRDLADRAGSGVAGWSAVPRGQWARPWEQNANTYYRRAWRVTSILQWIQDNVQCSHIICLASYANPLAAQAEVDYLMHTSQSIFAAAVGHPIPRSDALEQMGSRWYASIHKLQQDVASTIREIGRDRAVQIFRELGDARTASAVETWLPRDGMSSTELGAHWRATYRPQDLEFNWTPVTRHLSFESAKAFLDRALPKPVVVRTVVRTPRLSISAEQLAAIRDRQQQSQGSTSGKKAAVAVGAVGLLAVGLFLVLR